MTTALAIGRPGRAAFAWAAASAPLSLAAAAVLGGFVSSRCSRRLRAVGRTLIAISTVAAGITLAALRE